MPNNRVGDHDVNVLREYIQFFPENGLTISLKAFLDSEISPFPAALEGDKTVEKPVAPGDEQPDNNTVDAAAPDQLLDDMIVRLASKQYEGARLIYTGRSGEVPNINLVPPNLGRLLSSVG